MRMLGSQPGISSPCKYAGRKRCTCYIPNQRWKSHYIKRMRKRKEKREWNATIAILAE